MFKLSISESVILIAPDSVEKGETKINNCIANCKKSFFEKEKDEYEKAKKFSIISEMKANLVNKQ